MRYYNKGLNITYYFVVGMLIEDWEKHRFLDSAYIDSVEEHKTLYLTAQSSYDLSSYVDPDSILGLYRGEKYTLYIIDLQTVHKIDMKDVDLIYKGKYSKLSPKAKMTIHHSNAIEYDSETDQIVNYASESRDDINIWEALNPIFKESKIKVVGFIEGKNFLKPLKLKYPEEVYKAVEHTGEVVSVPDPLKEEFKYVRNKIFRKVNNPECFERKQKVDRDSYFC